MICTGHLPCSCICCTAQHTRYTLTDTWAGWAGPHASKAIPSWSCADRRLSLTVRAQQDPAWPRPKPFSRFIYTRLSLPLVSLSPSGLTLASRPSQLDRRKFRADFCWEVQCGRRRHGPVPVRAGAGRQPRAQNAGGAAAGRRRRRRPPVDLAVLPCQTAAAPLVLCDGGEQTPASSGALAAAFHLSKADLEWFSRKPSLFSPSRGAASLKVAVYAGRKGTTCGVSSGRLLGKATISLDLKGAEAKPAVLHSGWISIGKRRGKGSSAAAELSLTVRAEPDPRFVFEFDGEPECSPQVLQVRGNMKQPMFTCKFGCRSNSDLRRSVLQPEREAAGKERKGWSVTVHDLSGSPVALASMVTPFVASPGTDRVSRSNPGAWLILRPAGDGAWEPWARLECWRERGGAGAADSLGYRFELLLPGVDHAVPLAESSIAASKGGKFAIDMSAAQPLSRGGTPGCSPRGSGDFSQWPLGNYRGFVMSAAVQGEGRCSKPTVEVGVAHVGCAEDAAAFVALAAAVDLSMDACRLFSHRLRKELSHLRPDVLR